MINAERNKERTSRPSPIKPDPPRPPSWPAGNVFVGPNDIRAGWRLLIFLAIFVGLLISTQFALLHIPSVHAIQAAQTNGVLTPVSQLIANHNWIGLSLINGHIVSKRFTTFTTLGGR
jgi:hypothetical protein